MYCPKCGKENDKDWKFCKWCGSPLTDAPAVSPSPKNKMLFKFILAGIVVSASFALTIILLSGKRTQDPDREILAEASADDVSDSQSPASDLENPPPSQAEDTALDSSQDHETNSR